MTSSTANITNPANIVNPAKLKWVKDEQGQLVPISEMFDDVYYSLVDGLNESRYVFIEQNNLPQRFKTLFANSSSNQAQSVFTIAELGFGTGLNVLATWQLWQHIKSQFDTTQYASPRLHLISTEKFPLTYQDLKQSLTSWQQQDPTLVPLITQLLALYPTLVAGCHRLHLSDDVTLDLWLGDATASLAKLEATTAKVDAWYLDGFAPSCNESLWASQIFTQLARLSKEGTSAATFSCAGVVKRGFKEAGFTTKKVKGFGRKREMLVASKAVSPDGDLFNSDDNSNDDCQHTDTQSKLTQSQLNQFKPNQTQPNNTIMATAKTPKPLSKVAVIGAGVSGLLTAWVLASRGMQVNLLDKSAPLAGASGNPRALLAPKMTPLPHVAEHLHSIGYLYSQRFYQQLDQRQQLDQEQKNEKQPVAIFTHTGTLDLLTKANVDVSQIALYPDEMATTLTTENVHELSGIRHALPENLYLPQAGLVNPQALADTILAHPNISFQQFNVISIKTPNITNATKTTTPNETNARVELIGHSPSTAEATSSIVADAVVIAAAYESKALDERVFECRKIRGQLSWFIPTETQLQALPKIPLKFGGYCARFTPTHNDQQLNPVTANQPTFLLGASFVRNDTSTEIRDTEHESNCGKLSTALPELESILNHDANTLQNTTDNSQQHTDFASWQARVGIRAQTPDYHPVVGQVDEQGLIWTMCGMGSKGYAFAPLCAEILADKMTGQFAAISAHMLERLSPHRSTLKKPLK